MKRNRKTIYLIRHGEIDIEEKLCIGTTDVPLSEHGLMQAKRLGMWMARKVIRENAPYKIYSSPSIRCAKTAERMIELTPLKPDQIIVVPELHEIEMGEWDGMRFSEIKQRFPEAYIERGRHFWDYKVPGGESFEEAGKRFVAYLKELALEQNPTEQEEILYIVAHAGIIRAAIAYLGEADTDRLMDLDIKYASVTKIRSGVIAGQPDFEVEIIGGHPAAIPVNRRVDEILDRYSVPDHIRRHMKKVSEVLLSVADHIDPHREIYDRELLYSSAMLHDFAKLHKHLRAAGTEQLRIDGYELLADLIAEHETIELHRELAIEKDGVRYLSEEDLLYYADKRVKEDTIVSLQERFELSLPKCRTPEAVMKHRLRWNKAIAIENDIYRYSGKYIDF